MKFRFYICTNISMMDCNTYNELMRMGVNASFPTEDVDNRHTDNAVAEAELSPEERKKRHENAIAYMNSPEAQAFYKLLRQHEVNPFNALFYDKEDYSEDLLRERIAEISEFFSLPFPKPIDNSEYLASITYTEFTELGSEIRFNVDRLQQCGINNIDAFDAVMCHEVSHQYLADKELNFCFNNNWSIELGCDFFVGVRCASKLRATGKCKYVVSRMSPSETHPGGRFRVMAVMAGFEFVNWMISKGMKIDAEGSLLGLNYFMCTISKQLHMDYLSLEKHKTKGTNEIDISSLAETNLIKQAVQKYNNQKNHENC